jgi:hypothetical protein
MRLLLITGYSIWEPHWTGRFEFFAMMRLGAAIAEHLPLQATQGAEKLAVLDVLPSWVGARTGGEGKVGNIALGVRVPLRAKIRYPCLEFDHLKD